MKKLLRRIVFLVGLCAIAYVTFFVPLGEKTLYQHIVRIASSDEAQDLGRELGQAGERAGQDIENKLNDEDLRAAGQQIGDGLRRAADSKPVQEVRDNISMAGEQAAREVSMAAREAGEEAAREVGMAAAQAGRDAVQSAVDEVANAGRGTIDNISMTERLTPTMK